MNTTSLGAQLQLGPLPPHSIRVVGLDANGDVRAEAGVDAQGNWQLAAPVALSFVIAQLTGIGIAAALEPPANAAALRLPDRQTCRIEFTAVPAGARIWVDPISLDGFPDQYLPALRLHPDGTMDLHLGDYPCDPVGLTLQLQPGRYRVAGGVISLRPTGMSDAGFAIDRIEDLTAGLVLPSHEFDVGPGGVVLRVSFAPVGGQRGTP
jgi:hypothetical protein